MTKQPVNMKFRRELGTLQKTKSEKDPLSLKQNTVCLGGFASSFLSFLSVIGWECHKASLIIFQKERKIFVSECWDDFWRIQSKGCVIYFNTVSLRYWKSSFGMQCLSNNSMSFTCLFLKQLITLNAISLTYTRQESVFVFFFLTLSECYSSRKKGISSLAGL